ncbi:hypothetical protein AB0F72_26165 [Actinoplanes sp. NPDC023936]|uniref:hypothetical protein n=1 Tax=Actinoplanes sp. NPDC023936 TaxID=3154910 RepID=UPI0033F17317
MAKWLDYQTMTTMAKAVGGPRVLAAAFFVGGAVVTRGGEAGLRKILAMKRAFDARAEAAAQSRLHRVARDADAGGGLTLRAGDEFRVLARDGDAILIEVVGNANNPWYASSDLLASISDFTPHGEQG